jgi:hypothetical protein
VLERGCRRRPCPSAVHSTRKRSDDVESAA